MAQFRVEVRITAPVPLVWKRLTDWPAHARLAPLTTIRVIGPGDRPGSSFVARTGIGRLAFDDPMEIEEFSAPIDPVDTANGTGALSSPTASSGLTEVSGVQESAAARFRVRKTGWAIRGWIVAELRPLADQGGTQLVWTEEVRVPPEALTRFAGPLIALVAKAGYGAALRKLGREIEGERADG
jgi:hypothetical protein